MGFEIPVYIQLNRYSMKKLILAGAFLFGIGIYSASAQATPSTAPNVQAITPSQASTPSQTGTTTPTPTSATAPAGSINTGNTTTPSTGTSTGTRTGVSTSTTTPTG